MVEVAMNFDDYHDLSRAPYKTREHLWAEEQMPWLVNNTLDNEQSQRLHRHIDNCEQCQADYHQQQQLHSILMAEPKVDYAPQVSMQRLMSAIDKPGVSQGWGLQCRDFDFVTPIKKHFWPLVVGAQALALTVLALVVGLNQFESRKPIDAALMADYQTLSANNKLIKGPHLQVVFNDEVTSVQIRQMLESIHPYIVSGPSEQGVFRVQLNGASNLESAAKWLEQQQGVTFVAVQGH
jgi:hypothetical protein